MKVKTVKLFLKNTCALGYIIIVTTIITSYDVHATPSVDSKRSEKEQLVKNKNITHFPRLPRNSYYHRLYVRRP